MSAYRLATEERAAQPERAGGVAGTPEEDRS